MPDNTCKTHAATDDAPSRQADVSDGATDL